MTAPDPPGRRRQCRHAAAPAVPPRQSRPNSPFQPRRQDGSWKTSQARVTYPSAARDSSAVHPRDPGCRSRAPASSTSSNRRVERTHPEGLCRSPPTPSKSSARCPSPPVLTARHVTPRWTTLAAEVPSSTSTSRRYREALTCASSSPPPAPPTGWHAVADPRPGLVPQRAPGSDQCAAVGSRHPRLPRAPRAHRRYVANHEVGHSASGTRSALRRVTWHRSCSSKRTDCADASVTRGPAPAERTTPSA